MFAKEFFKKLAVSFCLIVSIYAASEATEIELVSSLGLGRGIPGYFKILTFDKARWAAFVDTFPEQPLAKNIKQHIDSIQLEPLVLSREDIFSAEFFKGIMRQKYCTSFKGDRCAAPNPRTVDSDGMFAGILNILHTTEGDAVGFEAFVEELITQSQSVVAAYNHRIAASGGNRALLKHFLSKIFFAEDAYADSVLTNMRMILLTEGLVAGDDHLFGVEVNLSHTIAQSLLRRVELDDATDTLVLGCGNSLIADVTGTAAYFADDFLKAHAKKTFIHSCQHCHCNHGGQITVALYEAHSAATYDGGAHADIFADAVTPTFWAALIQLKTEGRSPIRNIIDHSFMLSAHEEYIANSLGVGGTFRTYLPDLTEKFESVGFELQGTQKFGERTEYIYVKVR
jgi:hypothetical protein